MYKTIYKQQFHVLIINIKIIIIIKVIIDKKVKVIINHQEVMQEVVKNLECLEQQVI
jgi:hypothetical protein